MALDFPSSPADGNIFSTGNVTYIYSEDKNIWYTTSNVSYVETITTPLTYSAKQTFIGSATDVSAEFKNIVEDGTVSATAATGAIDIDVLSQSVLYYSSNATSNFDVNVRGDSSTALEDLLDVGDSITVAFLVTNGSTGYYLTNVQVDGSNVTPKWQGGSAPSEGNADSIDSYSITVIKTAATPTYTVLASQTQFA